MGAGGSGDATGGATGGSGGASWGRGGATGSGGAGWVCWMPVRLVRRTPGTRRSGTRVTRWPRAATHWANLVVPKMYPAASQDRSSAAQPANVTLLELWRTSHAAVVGTATPILPAARAAIVVTRSGPDGPILPPSAILLRTGAYPVGFCHIQRRLDSEQQSFARCLSVQV